MMRALKINFGGPSQISIDWNAEVTGIEGVAQRAGVSVMTQLGSDKFLPSRGTEVVSVLFSYGAFDLLSMQHTLNFGALKAIDDMRDYEAPSRTAADSISNIGMALIDVVDNAAHVSVQVTNVAKETTRKVTTIP